MPLQVGVLPLADRGHMLGALARIARRPPEDWCPIGHPAYRGQLPKWPVMATVSAAQSIEAVAASAPNHCIDGWSYAARSLSALLSGDSHAARHLSYYAQLRAGLSLLANLGVGIFNRTNFVITASGSILRLDTHPVGKPNKPGLGTHEIVWTALKEWSLDPSTARQFLALVKIRGVALQDCLDLIWPATPSATIAAALIEAWGLDLQRGKDEHYHRNISSYVPQSMNPLQPTAPDGLNFVKEFWHLFEPTTGASFDRLDRHLLRSLLLRQHRDIHNNENYYTGAIERNYNNLPEKIQTLASKEFLTNTIETGVPTLLAKASISTAPSQAPEMLARAFLLLRAATGFTYTSFVEAGINCAGGELRAWIDPWAVSRGFWPPGSPLSDPIDLWADIELALDDFRSSLDPSPYSLSDWMGYTLKGVPTIAETERIGVWSFCS